MPRAYPQEFREDVVRIARQGELTYSQIAKNFGISETCVSNWVRRADVEDGKRPGTTAAETSELREARKRRSRPSEWWLFAFRTQVSDVIMPS